MYSLKANRIVTAHYSERLALDISFKFLRFTSLPWYPCFDEFEIAIQDSLGRTFLHSVIKREDGKLDISSLKRGTYFVNIYIAKMNSTRPNVTLLHENIMINVGDDKCFSLPISFEANRNFINKIPTFKTDLLKYTLSTKNIECHKQEINKLAIEICKFSHNDYNRLLCIHDWIAQNLYYDMDSINSGDYAINSHKAIDAIKCDKKCVCSDFSYLTVALARSLSIPSICITCKTDDKRECWGGTLSNTISADHIFAASFVDNRWILMDNTWDCGNQIVNGLFYKRSQGYDRKYFDVSLEILSSSHRFVDIYV